MYRNILVAVDGSHTSEMALREAIKLARDLNGKLRIVHAVEMVNLNFDSEFPGPNEIWEAMRKSGEAILAKAQAAVLLIRGK